VSSEQVVIVSATQAPNRPELWEHVEDVDSNFIITPLAAADHPIAQVSITHSVTCSKRGIPHAIICLLLLDHGEVLGNLL
jgi:hypothetical protein